MSVMRREVRAYYKRGGMVDRVTVVTPDGDEWEIPWVHKVTRVIEHGSVPLVTLEVFGRLVEVWQPDQADAEESAKPPKETET